jgi:hypothetical protein
MTIVSDYGHYFLYKYYIFKFRSMQVFLQIEVHCRIIPVLYKLKEELLKYLL